MRQFLQSRSILLILILGIFIIVQTLLLENIEDRSGPKIETLDENTVDTPDIEKQNQHRKLFENEPIPRQSYREPYFNLNEKDPFVPQYLPTEFYPPQKSGPCIAFLLAARQKDINDAKVALKSLKFLQGDKDPEHLAPVLIFNEGNIPKESMNELILSTNRPVAFPHVNFQQFPPGFDPAQEEIQFKVKGRENEWGYYQMIRFWVTTIWRHPAVQNYDTVMRLDSDSCFKEPNVHLPNFMYDGLYYWSQYVGVEPAHGANFIQGIYDFMIDYMTNVGKPSEARNTLLWDYVESVWHTKNTLPLFRTNFELSRRDFMQRGDVVRFHEALTEKEPFGVLRQRWGDAVLRFMLASVFEVPDRIMTVRPTGYFHKAGCSEEEVDEALNKYYGGEAHHQNGAMMDKPASVGGKDDLSEYLQHLHVP